MTKKGHDIFPITFDINLIATGHAYEFQVNYKEDKKPSFRSDRASFFTIMPNLNYLGDNVAHNVAQTLAEIIVEEIQKTIKSHGNK